MVRHDDDDDDRDDHHHHADHDYENEDDDDDLPGPATSVRTVRVAEEFPSCLLVNAFAQIVYFLYGSAHIDIIIIMIMMRAVRQNKQHSPRS